MRRKASADKGDSSVTSPSGKMCALRTGPWTTTQASWSLRGEATLKMGHI